MHKVPTALHLSLVHEDIAKQLANYNDNYNFFVYPYSKLQKFIVNSKMIVTNHLKIVRKSHAWHTGFPRVMRRLALMTEKLDIP